MRPQLTLLLTLLLLCPAITNGQKVAVKTNALYLATTTPNLSLEVALSKKLTLDLQANYNPWTLETIGAVRITNLQIEKQEETLCLTFDVAISEKAMNYRQSWSIIPEIISTTSAESTLFSTLLINGRQKERHYKRKLRFNNAELLANLPLLKTHVPQDTTLVFTYEATIPHQTWMENSRIQLNQILTSSREKKQLFVIEDSKRITPPATAAPLDMHISFAASPAAPKERNIQAQAYLDFPVGKTTIQPGFRNNPAELTRIAEYITQVTENPDIHINQISIEGYASPEGSYALNDRLSCERATALRDYLVQTYNLPLRQINVSSVAEDWNGLGSLIHESHPARKTDILAIIRNDAAPDRKEQQLRALGSTWNTLVQEYFPHLRRVEYRIDYTIRQYTLEETKELLTRNPEMLSLHEFYLVARAFPDGSSEQDHIYQLALRTYPDDPIAIHNYAAVLLRNGDNTAAGVLLQRIKEHPVSWNNLGIYHYRSREEQQAETYLRQAVANGVPEAIHNLGLLAP